MTHLDAQHCRVYLLSQSHLHDDTLEGEQI